MLVGDSLSLLIFKFNTKCNRFNSWFSHLKGDLLQRHFRFISSEVPISLKILELKEIRNENKQYDQTE